MRSLPEKDRRSIAGFYNKKIKMHLFYTSEINGNIAILNESETRHCKVVLRKKQGDEIVITNGKGVSYKAEILELGKRNTTLSVLTEIERISPPLRQLFLAFALTKSSSRFEWMIEKCVEVGVSGFIPLLCERSERKKFNYSRTADIALSAMKQSGRLFLPELHPLVSVDEAVQILKQKGVGRIYSAGQKAENNILDVDDGKEHSAVFIGPEGDFSETELNFMHQNGMNYVNLNGYRLRTETAGLVAITLLNARQAV